MQQGVILDIICHVYVRSIACSLLSTLWCFALIVVCGKTLYYIRSFRSTVEKKLKYLSPQIIRNTISLIIPRDRLLNMLMTS